MASTDRDALIALYHANGGADDWKFFKNWNTEDDLSTWYGVNVNAQGRVVKLYLSHQILRGHIPPQLGDLRALKSLHLDNNKLEGPIPPKLGKLAALQCLSLSRNQLTGPIPPEIGNLTALDRLSLWKNQLSGPIPSELGNLSALKELKLLRNQLSGPIPPELGKLAALQRLRLENNQLTGSIPSELGNLSALKTLSLGGNQLTGTIPSELGKLSALKQLYLQGNQLSRPIPPELGKLTALEKLSLWNNQLSGHIPPELGDLSELQELYLYNNKLAGPIPPELGNLSGLQYLVLNGNKLSGPIPPELGNLSGLQRLYLTGNGLSGTIPRELGKLQELKSLEVNSNELTGLWDCSAYAEGGEAHVEYQSGGGIPRELDELLSFLGGLQSFFCGSNPWMEPPAAVLGDYGNIPVVRLYFEGLYREEQVVSRSLKVVLVGREGTGKTSLRQSIAARRAEPTKGPVDSTVHMTIEDTTLRGVSVRILDCAGQVAYYGLLQLFLTRRAVYLLVWDVSQEGCNEVGESCTTDDLQTLGILPWLTALSFRLPGGDVILVGNKCDLRSDARGSAAQAASRVESSCRGWLARVRSSGGRAVEIEEGTSLTSCARPGWWEYLRSSALGGLAWITGYKLGWPCDWSAGAMGGKPLPSLIDRIVRASDDGRLRAEKMVLPKSWDLALSFLRDLSDNKRNDAMAGGRYRTVEREGPRPVSHSMARGELFPLWEDTVRENELPVPNPTSALEGALTIREYEGTVLSVGTYVFLDVNWLAKVLEPLLNHKGIEDKGGVRVYGDVEVTDRRQENSLRRLKDKGILEQRLAAFLWSGYAEHVLAALKRIGLTFPLPRDGEGGLVVPLRLPETRPPDVGQHLSNFREGQKSLTMHCNLPDGVPPGGIERIVSLCSHIGAASLFWRYGVLVRVGAAVEEGEEGGDGVGRSRFMLEYDRYRQELVIAVRGDLTKTAAWAALSYVTAIVIDMTRQYPGLRWEAFLGCPDHPNEAMSISEAQRDGDRLVAKEHICEKCQFEGKGSAFLASELLQAYGVHGPPDVMFQKTVDRISENLRTRGSTVGTSAASSPETQRGLVENQAARQLEEILHRVLAAVDHPLPDEGIEPLTANLRNLRLHCTREDVQRIVDESNKEVVRKLLQAMTSLETSQSAGQRLLARELAVLTVRIPSHAVLLPPRDDETREMDESERKESSWIQRLKVWHAGGKRKGKGVMSKEYRLFFLCGHDRSLAECGFEGKGYRIKCPREWVKRGGVPFLKALLIVVNIALKAVAGLSIPADGIVSAGGKTWGEMGEILSSKVEAAAEDSIDAACSKVGEMLDEGSAATDSVDETGLAGAGHGMGDPSNASSPLPTPPREATEMLEKLVRDLSVKGIQESSGAGKTFYCFDTTMQLVDKAGRGDEWSWVRTKNVPAFTRLAREEGSAFSR